MLKSKVGKEMKLRALAKFDNSMVLIKSVPRYITLVMGLAIYTLMLSAFSTTFFSDIIIAYSIAGILLWLADFGSSNWMLLHSGDDNIAGLRQEWTGKLIRICVLGTLSFTFFKFLQDDSPLAVLVFVCMLDLDSDTSLGLRQLIYSLKTAAIIQIAKKGFQLISLICWELLNWPENIFLFAFIFLLPVIMVKLLDTKQIGGFKFQAHGETLKNSFPMWLQGGFSPLSNLDLVLLSLLGSETLVVTLAFAKKIISSLFILGTTLSAETLGSKKLKKESLDSLMFSPAVKSVLVFSTFLSVLLIVFLNYVLSLLGSSQSNSLNTSVLILTISTIPINILASYYNTLLIKSRHILLAACQGYSSVLFYLILILGFGLLNRPEIGLMISLVCRVFVELTTGLFFLRYAALRA